MRDRRVLLLFVVVCLVLGAFITRRWYLNRSVYRADFVGSVRGGEMPAPGSGLRILIFAPHEDDETLGCAGCIGKAMQAGARVHLVLVTNGEYPELDIVLFEDTLRMQPEEFIRLGYMRQKETLAAMEYLGLPRDALTFLGYPNQYLNQMWLPGHWLPDSPVRSRRTRSTRSPYSNSMTRGAVYCGQSALQDVETVLRREKPDIVITLHPNDVHVDHWPTYTLVRFALSELAARGEQFARECQVYTYLIHRDPWPRPRGYHPRLRLLPPVPLAETGQSDWLILPLTDLETARKHRATSLYKTQGGGIDRLLLAFSRSNELFGEVPIRPWPASENVPDTEVIRDPTGDLTSNAGDPHADIRLVSLSRKGSRMTVTIETRKAATGKTCYRLSIHGGGSGPADRTIAEYAWKGAQPTGHVLRDGVLRKIVPQEMRTDIAGGAAVLEADWPFTGREPAFFMIRAWTTEGRKVIDQTATETFAVRGGRRDVSGFKLHVSGSGHLDPTRDLQPAT